MFCDLVESTQLSEKLDPEDLQKLIDAYRRECSMAIRRYEGEVARRAARTQARTPHLGGHLFFHRAV